MLAIPGDRLVRSPRDRMRLDGDFLDLYCGYTRAFFRTLLERSDLVEVQIAVNFVSHGIQVLGELQIFCRRGQFAQDGAY